MKEKQAEFFDEFQNHIARKRASREMALAKRPRLNLSYENLVLFFIVIIMLAVVFFSLGVEKGKRIARQAEGEIIAELIKKSAKNTVFSDEKMGTISDKAIEGNKEHPSEVLTAEIGGPARNSAANTSVKPYTIQVVAFKKEQTAKDEKQRLEKNGYEVMLIPSKEWMQVCVGRYGNVKETQGDLEALRKKYPSCYVRKIE